MTTHETHWSPAVRALVERAKAEERERIARAIEAVRSPSLSATERGHLDHAARIARADSLAAQLAPEAATVEEVRPSDVRKVVSEALDDVANNLMPRPTSDEWIAIRVLAAFDVRRKP